jgi:hypothetical protein
MLLARESYRNWALALSVARFERMQLAEPGVTQCLPLIDRDELSADRFAHIFAQGPVQPVVG